MQVEPTRGTATSGSGTPWSVRLALAIAALLGSLGAATRAEATDAQQDSGPALDKDYEILLDALGFEQAGVDILVARTGLTADAVASMLLILELEGRIAQQPGGLFCRRLPGK